MTASMESLPAEFPIFPLPGAVVLPGGKLPLNIFEPRYKAMVEDALGAGRMFGMVQPDELRPSGPNGPALYRVGCLSRITSFSETEDGRYLITLTGVIRFGVGPELPLRRGYRRIEGDLRPFQGDLLPAADGVDREALLDALRGYFAAQGLDANWDAIRDMPDSALVMTLSMVCPFEPPEKQALLEAADPAARADTLLTLLRMGAHAPEDGQPGRKVS